MSENTLSLNLLNTSKVGNNESTIFMVDDTKKDYNKIELKITNGEQHPVVFTAMELSATDLGSIPLLLEVTNVLSVTELSGLTIDNDDWKMSVLKIKDGHWSSTYLAFSPNSGKSVSIAPSSSLCIKFNSFSAIKQPYYTGFSIITANYKTNQTTKQASFSIPIHLKNPPIDTASDLMNDMAVSFVSSTIYRSTDASIKNKLNVCFAYTKKKGKLVSQTSSGEDPVFTISFITCQSGPGYYALARTDEIKNIGMSVIEHNENYEWTIRTVTQTNDRYWQLTPQNSHILSAEAPIVKFELDDIVSSLKPGNTLMYVYYNNVPGYNDGNYAVLINKADPKPTALEFSVTGGVTEAAYGTPVDLTVKVYGSPKWTITCSDLVEGIATLNRDPNALTEGTVTLNFRPGTYRFFLMSADDESGMVQENTHTVTVNQPKGSFDGDIPSVVHKQQTLTASPESGSVWRIDRQVPNGVYTKHDRTSVTIIPNVVDTVTYKFVCMGYPSGRAAVESNIAGFEIGEVGAYKPKSIVCDTKDVDIEGFDTAFVGTDMQIVAYDDYTVSSSYNWQYWQSEVGKAFFGEIAVIPQVEGGDSSPTPPKGFYFFWMDMMDNGMCYYYTSDYNKAATPKIGLKSIGRSLAFITSFCAPVFTSGEGEILGPLFLGIDAEFEEKTAIQAEEKTANVYTFYRAYPENPPMLYKVKSIDNIVPNSTRIRSDASNLYFCSNVFINHKDGIYRYPYSTGGLSKPDMKDGTCIVPCHSAFMDVSIADKMIYWLDQDEDALYKCDFDGNDKSKLCDVSLFSTGNKLCVSTNYHDPYFIESDYNLYRYSGTRQAKEKLCSLKSVWDIASQHDAKVVQKIDNNNCLIVHD